MTARIVLTILLVLLSLGIHADDGAQGVTREEFEASLKYQHGEVALPNGVATLKVPDNFRYLGPADAQRILEQA